MDPKKQRSIKLDVERNYLKVLEELGGTELVTSGKQVVADYKAGKAVKPAKLPRKDEKRRSKADAKGNVVGFIGVDAGTLARYGLCVASCMARSNHFEKAACVFFCLGAGVPDA
jgi:hypothetical protein